jgi:hypothetical protein
MLGRDEYRRRKAAQTARVADSRLNCSTGLGLLFEVLPSTWWIVEKPHPFARADGAFGRATCLSADQREALPQQMKFRNRSSGRAIDSHQLTFGMYTFSKQRAGFLGRTASRTLKASLAQSGVFCLGLLEDG